LRDYRAGSVRAWDQPEKEVAYRYAYEPHRNPSGMFAGWLKDPEALQWWGAEAKQQCEDPETVFRFWFVVRRARHSNFSAQEQAQIRE
jgi:hypothetical protein